MTQTLSTPCPAPTKILVLNAGGTLSMTSVDQGPLKNQPGYFPQIVGQLRKLEEEERKDQFKKANAAVAAAKNMPVHLGQPTQFAQSHRKNNAIRAAEKQKQLANDRMATKFPLDSDLVEVAELSKVLDSSEMQPSDWLLIAQYIFARKDHYCGFVVVHGTDTLGYTAAALTFLLSRVQKPIIITGSQRPILPIMNDTTVDSEALNNLLRSCEFARENLPAVLVFFHRKLMLGVRTTKISAASEDHAAFDCPKTLPVVELRWHQGIKHRWDNQSLIKAIRERAKTDLDAVWRKPLLQLLGASGIWPQSKKVALLRLFPGIDGTLINAVLSTREGIVLQAFGSGNGPINTDDFKSAIASAVTHKHKVVCFVTDCMHGSVGDDYATSLSDQTKFPGIVPCENMTAEAAYAKLSVAYALNLSVTNIHKQLKKNQHGESD